MVVQICVGSSCHLKGSQRIVELFQKSISENGLQDKIELKGSFCFGECANKGVTIKIDDKMIVGVTEENFNGIFEENILKKGEKNE